MDTQDPPTAAGGRGSGALTDAELEALEGRLLAAGAALTDVTHGADTLLQRVQGLAETSAPSPRGPVSAPAVDPALHEEARLAAERAAALRAAADAAAAKVAAREQAQRDAARLAHDDVLTRGDTPPAAAAPTAPKTTRPRLRPSDRRGRGLGLVPVVLFTVGGLAVADAVVTLVWQEPISYLSASREQSELREDLQTLGRAPILPAVDLPPEPADRMAELATALTRKSKPGAALGRVAIPSIDARYVLVQGTGAASLRRGPGHYAATALPGLRGTVGVAGHRTTYLAPFRRINELRADARVLVEMPYGRFEYRVRNTRIVPPTEGSVLDNGRFDQIVLTACHPLYSAAKRIVVTARLVRAVPSGAAVSPVRAGAGVPLRPT